MEQDVWEPVLPLVSSPARYTDHEWNARRKPMAQAAVRALLLYPDCYEQGASDYGLSVVYHVLNDHPDFAADRAFLPWPDMRQAMRARGLRLFGLESREPAAGMHVVFLLMPSAISFAAIPILMSLAGAPLVAAERGDNDPIVIGLGPAAANPEPVAEFLDAVLLGDLEHALLEICSAIAEQTRAPRDERLARLAGIEGVYVPAFYAGAPGRGAQPTHRDAPPIVRFRTASLDEATFPAEPVVPFVATKLESAQVEIARGCACQSALCAHRYRSGPARTRPAEQVARLALRTLDRTGYDALTLLGAHGLRPDEAAGVVSECLAALGEQRVRVRLPSLPASHIEAVSALGLPALDVEMGPASDRLRTMLELQGMEEIKRAVERAVAAGARNVCLHITVGMPGETEEDVRQAGLHINELSRLSRLPAGRARGLRLAAEIHVFRPEPHTPGQWSGTLPVEVMRGRLAAIRETGGRRVQLRLPSCEEVILAACLARAGREMSGALRSIIADGENSLDPGALVEALQRAGVDVEGEACRRLDPRDRLPWDHLQYAASREELEAAAGMVGL
jgi:radical SAM superfamily enzyme YgiQ (UPF0313 family)